jgi:hypothetical protein
MKFSYKLSQWDYGEASRLHRHQKVGRRVRFQFIYRVVPVFCVVGLVLLGAYDIKAHTLPAWLLLSFAITLLWLGILMAFAPRENVRRAFRRSVTAGQISICVDDEYVLVQVPGVSETKMVWKAFVGIARNDKMILLYTSEDCFLIFPTSAMSMEQQIELNSAIDRNLARK